MRLGTHELTRTISHYAEYCVVFLADATLIRHNGDCSLQLPEIADSKPYIRNAPAFAIAHLASLGDYSLLAPRPPLALGFLKSTVSITFLLRWFSVVPCFTLNIFSDSATRPHGGGGFPLPPSGVVAPRCVASRRVFTQEPLQNERNLSSVRMATTP